VPAAQRVPAGEGGAGSQPEEGGGVECKIDEATGYGKGARARGGGRVPPRHGTTPDHPRVDARRLQKSFP